MNNENNQTNQINQNQNQNQNQNSQNNMNINMSNIQRDAQTEEYMYPEVYKKLSPICDQIIRDMERQYGNICLSEDILNQMTDEALRRSEMGMQNPDPYNAKDGDSIQTIREFGRHDGFHRDPWRHYERSALSDIAGILFLNRIFGRRRPFWRWR